MSFMVINIFQIQYRLGYTCMNQLIMIKAAIYKNQLTHQKAFEYQDRITKFPFNVIGQIMFKQQESNNKQPQTKLTGFLISASLVLTCCISQNEYRKENTSMYFSLLSPKENGQVEQIRKIKTVETSFKFDSIVGVIEMLQETLLKEQFKTQRQKLSKNIIKLQEKAIQRGYALLKLQQGIYRTLYFEICSNLNPQSELEMAGFITNHSGKKYNEFKFISGIKQQQINNGLIYYDIDGGFYQRGSPLYIKEDCEKLVGIYWGYDKQRKLHHVIMTTLIANILRYHAQRLDAFFGKYNQKVAKENIRKQINEIKKNRDQLIIQIELNIQQKRKKESINYANMPYNIGTAYECSNNKQALEYYTKELKIYQEKRINSVECAIILNNIGIVYKKEGKFKQAIQHCRQAMTIYEGKGKQSIIGAMIFNNIGQLYYSKAKIEQAIGYYQKEYITYKKLEQKQNLLARAFCNLEKIYRQLGRHKQALQLFQQSSSIQQKAGIISITWTQQTQNPNNIGYIYQNQGTSKQVLRYKGSLTIHERIKIKAKKLFYILQDINNKSQFKLNLSDEQIDKEMEIYLKRGTQLT